MHNKNKKKWIHRKIKISLIYADVFKEFKTYKKTRLSWFLLLFLFLSLLITIFWMITVFTPLKTLIPDYPNKEIRENIILNNIKVDSLENELILRDKYLAQIRDMLLSAGPVNDSLFKANHPDIELSNVNEITESNSIVESVYNQQDNSVFQNLFPPVIGHISNSFSDSLKHYGTDIIPDNNKSVFASARGRVIYSSYSISDGYCIVLQHNNNMITVYKHNIKNMVNVGDYVEAGEIISEFGNTGILTTGPHLHFEIWINGKAVNPEDYIDF